jgi:hypothetical protein
VAGLAGTVKLAAEALKEPGPISGIALRLDGDDRTPWMPPPSHPSYKAFQPLRLQSRREDYVQQADMLKKLNEKNGDGVFVAPFAITLSPKRSLFSLAE